MRDIETQEDVLKLVTQFYTKAVPDQVIGHFFTQVVQLDFDKHIPKIADFWSGLLLGTGTFKGNVMEAHVKLNKLEPMQAQHFERWVELWTLTIDELFAGSKADEAKHRGASIAQFMLYKLNAT